MPMLSSFADNDDQRKELIETFDAVKIAEAPSLVRQLAWNADRGFLSDEQIEEVEEAFDGLSDEIGDEFEPRRELDKAILSAANMEDARQEEFLDKFYSDMLVEIVSLKLMMDS